MKRPLKNRVWVWGPQWHWYGWRTLIPFTKGGDEFDWHTIGIGWTITGRAFLATRPCPETGKCANAEDEQEQPMAEWPVDMYGVNHVTGENPNKPCGGVNSNVCVAEGCYAEACLGTL